MYDRNVEFPWSFDELEVKWGILTSGQDMEFHAARTILLKIFPPFLQDWARFVTPLLDGRLDPNPFSGDGLLPSWLIVYWHVRVKRNYKGSFTKDFESREPEPAAVEIIDAQVVEEFDGWSGEIGYIKVNFTKPVGHVQAAVAEIYERHRLDLEARIRNATGMFDKTKGIQTLIKIPKNRGFNKTDWAILRSRVEGKSLGDIAESVLGDPFKGNSIGKRLENIIGLLDLRGHHTEWCAQFTEFKTK